MGTEKINSNEICRRLAVFPLAIRRESQSTRNGVSRCSALRRHQESSGPLTGKRTYVSPQPSVRNKRRATDCNQVKHSAKEKRVGSASANVSAHLPGDAAFGGTGDANYDANSGCHKECGAGDARVMLPLRTWKFRSWCRC